MKGEEKLSALRSLMKTRGYDAYIIPHEDQHDNEYIAEGDERIKFISNFSGSNGIGLVTQDVALMWTDGRYYIQIEKELYPGWKMKKIARGEESIIQYITKNLNNGINIGMDFNLFSFEKASEYQEVLSQCDMNMIDDKENIIDEIWGKEKPGYKCDKVLILEEKYTGMSVKEKYAKLDQRIKASKKEISDYTYFISRLDDIAWLLNLRGNDIPYNPVFFSFALFNCSKNSEFSVDLFIDPKKIEGEEYSTHCKENSIHIHPYQEIFSFLSSPISSDPNTPRPFLFPMECTNFRIFQLIIENPTLKNIELNIDFIEHMKSVKNPVEIEGYKKANLKDSVALIKFFTWMETELLEKKRTDLNEYEIGLYNKKVREEQENFMGEAFAPICAAGANAAIIHYEQNENLHSDMNKDILILCDTGGQYLDGTCDITRTVHYGEAKKEEKEMYTRVLLGNLSLERLMFREGKRLYNLDAVPRSFLYMVGEDYEHGTSHGVGHFLNVHEGPYGEVLKEGNIITNEPGYYKKDHFGIRIENEVLVVRKGEKMLGFENLTLLPYERNLIDLDLLSNDFKKYIDDYHKKVYEKLSPFLQNDPKALDYLKRKTEPL